MNVRVVKGLTLSVVGLFVVLMLNGCNHDEQHQMIFPAFTDLGVGSLISSARYKMTQVDYNNMVNNTIVPYFNSPTTSSLSLPVGDICLPPTHGGWSSQAPPPIPWTVDAKIATALSNTLPNVKNDIATALLNFWSMNRGSGSTPNLVICEVIGLDSPVLISPNSVGMYTGVTTLAMPNTTSPTTVRIVVTYQPGP